MIQPGQQIKCMIVDHDKVNGRIALSTKTLEPEPGDMLKDRQKVFAQAEQTAKKYHARMEAERSDSAQATSSLFHVAAVDPLGRPESLVVGFSRLWACGGTAGKPARRPPRTSLWD